MANRLTAEMIERRLREHQEEQEVKIDKALSRIRTDILTEWMRWRNERKLKIEGL